MFANLVFITPGRIIFVQTRFVAVFFIILVQTFCPLKTHSAQFLGGFRINTYSVNKAEEIIRKDIEENVQGLTPEEPLFYLASK